ncbi:MAG: hypothetical protein ABIP64_00390 [Burkholderiales bacterium]
MVRQKISIIFVAVAIASAAIAANAGQATIVSINAKCNLALVKKSDEYGLVTLFAPGAAAVDDVVEGDFDSIKYMRKAQNVTAGKDIMIRGVRYSSSRKILESEIPKECLEMKGEPVAPAAQ